MTEEQKMVDRLRAEEDQLDREAAAMIERLVRERDEARKDLRMVRDALIDMQPHIANTKAQAGPFCAPAQIIDDEISDIIARIGEA